MEREVWEHKLGSEMMRAWSFWSVPMPGCLSMMEASAAEVVVIIWRENWLTVFIERIN